MESIRVSRATLHLNSGRTQLLLSDIFVARSEQCEILDLVVNQASVRATASSMRGASECGGNWRLRVVAAYITGHEAVSAPVLPGVVRDHRRHSARLPRPAERPAHEASGRRLHQGH